MDANLSQSIRHGPIISGIRSIFDKSKLVTRKSKSGHYQPNTYWSERIGNSEIECEAAFAEFSTEIDQFIRHIRDREIQIWSADNVHGLLNYEFSGAELKAIFDRIEPLHEVDDVLDIVLAALVRRTGECLCLLYTSPSPRDRG